MKLEHIDTAIETIVSKIDTHIKPDEALKLSQAALNLAHVEQVLKHSRPPTTSCS